MEMRRMATLNIELNTAGIVQFVKPPEIKKLCRLLEQAQIAVNAIEAWGVENGEKGSPLVKTSCDATLDGAYQNLWDQVSISQ